MKAKSKSDEPVDGAQMLYNEFIAGNKRRELLFCEAGADYEIASALYDMREDAGLTQKELADMIGTKKSAISRIEDGDYKGHSLGMLHRVADALGYTVSVNFQKNKKASKSKSKTKAKAQARSKATPVKKPRKKTPSDNAHKSHLKP